MCHAGNSTPFLCKGVLFVYAIGHKLHVSQDVPCSPGALEHEGPSLWAGGYSHFLTFVLHEGEYQLSKRLGKQSTAGEFWNALCGQLTK